LGQETSSSKGKHFLKCTKSSLVAWRSALHALDWIGLDWLNLRKLLMAANGC
jgi:hypothetical protein